MALVSLAKSLQEMGSQEIVASGAAEGTVVVRSPDDRSAVAGGGFPRSLLRLMPRRGILGGH